MRAVQAVRFGGPEALEPVEVERPSPISTEVRVAVAAAGVNPVDCKTRRGEGVARWVGAPPFIPGWDVAGTVDATGYGVTRLAVGDRVLGMPWFPRRAGAYAEHVTAPSRQLARVPDGMDLREAAALPLAGLTAWQSLVDTADLRAGQTVLVLGAAGGVGHLAVQVAKARGASVVASARPERHAFLRELGADELVDRTSVPTAQAAREVDVALDLLGGEHTRAALETVRPGGVLLAVADGADERVLAEAERRGVRVSEPLVEPDGHGLELLLALMGEGRLRVTVEEALPLADARRAHERVEAGGVRGKLVLEVGAG